MRWWCSTRGRRRSIQRYCRWSCRGWTATSPWITRPWRNSTGRRQVSGSRARSRAAGSPRLHQGVLRGGVVRRLDLQLTGAHAPGAVEQAARRRPRGVLAVGVVDTAVTRAHEQARLREPGHGTSQVGAIDGKDQEAIPLLVVLALVADVDARVGGHAVPWLAERVHERLQPGLVEQETAHRAKGYPRGLLPAHAEQVADERDGHEGRGDAREAVG